MTTFSFQHNGFAAFGLNNEVGVMVDKAVNPKAISLQVPRPESDVGHVADFVDNPYKAKNELIGCDGMYQDLKFMIAFQKITLRSFVNTPP